MIELSSHCCANQAEGVIEYQGGGYYQGNASEMDAVKRTVLPRAGIRYIEVAALLSGRRSQLDALLDEELRAARP